jgi:hypothetical protein
MLSTTLAHNQHDIIDIIWRLPVWNVKIRRYLASCTLQFWYNLWAKLAPMQVPPTSLIINAYSVMSGLILILYRLSKFLIYFFFYLYISFQANESTSTDTKGYSWKDLPSWKCEIVHVPLLCYGEYTYDCKLKKFQEMLLTTLAHNQHDIIDIIHRNTTRDITITLVVL